MCVKNCVGSDKMYRIRFRKLNPLLKGLKEKHKKPRSTGSRII